MPRVRVGSNLGPTSKKLVDGVRQRVVDYRIENGLGSDAMVPTDAVTASASGLDPHISVKNALLQARRVAKARNLTVELVMEKVDCPYRGPDSRNPGRATCKRVDAQS